MRCQIKKTGAVSRMLAFIFCIVIFVGELNALGMDWNPGQTRMILTQTLPKGYAHEKKNDVVAEFPRALEEEAVGESLMDFWSRSLSGSLPLKYLAARGFFLPAPLILCSERTAAMKEGDAVRKYLIRYIHDSDGEKGVYALV